MTPQPITVAPETSVVDIARVLLEHDLSAVPVVDSASRVVGIVSEGDLMRRTEVATERQRPWWLALVASRATLADEYARSHGLRASDVMTSTVASVAEHTPVRDIVELLEARHIKRVPVMRQDRLVGIVSRLDILRALIAARPRRESRLALSDGEIRDHLLQDLEKVGWATTAHLNPIVSNGTVHLWGLVGSDEERHAIRVAAERIPDVRAVEDHLRRGSA
jgi:CBS domain-containing protein